MADQWMEPYRQFFGERLDRLDLQLKAMMAARRDAAKTSKEGDGT
jgi:hypothetical protein